MQYTKPKYLIYFYKKTCGNLINFKQDQIEHITKNEKSIRHEHRRILWGKPQLKTLISVLSYKWKYIRITQSFSSQAIQLSVQSLNVAHRLNRHNICLPGVLQASYFLAQFLLGPPAATCVILTSHTTLTSEITAQSWRSWFLLHGWVSFIGKFLQ